LDLLAKAQARYLEVLKMGNAKFFYYPQPDGRHLVEIDMQEPIAELQSEISHDAVDGITQGGGIFRSVGRGGESITIQRDRMQLGEDLAIQFDALQNHLDRGFACSFVTDHEKPWAASLSTPPQAGGFTFQVKDNPFIDFTGSGTVPVAGDYVVVETDSPPYIREVQKIDSISVTASSGGSVTFTKRLNFDYTDRVVFMRFYRFWYGLKRPQSDIGTPIITNENGRLFSLSIRLVVDYQTYFAKHNGEGFSVPLIGPSPVSGPLPNNDGRSSIDSAQNVSGGMSISDLENLTSRGSGSFSYSLSNKGL